MLSFPNPKHQAVDHFVFALWQHMRMRALGANPGELTKSVKQVRHTLNGIDPIKQQQEIGESLAAHILKFTVQHYSRHNCITCTKFADCSDATVDSCDHFIRDEKAYKNGRALLVEAIFRLDGAYGIDARELISVVCRFLDEMDKDQGRDNDGSSKPTTLV